MHPFCRRLELSVFLSDRKLAASAERSRPALRRCPAGQGKYRRSLTGSPARQTTCVCSSLARLTPSLSRMHSFLQTRLAFCQTERQKARRVCRKVASSSKKVSSRARQLQTQFDQLTSGTDTDKLLTTVDEQDQRLSYYQEKAKGYKQSMLRTPGGFRH